MNNIYTENILEQSDFQKFLSESMTVSEDRAFRNLVGKRFGTIMKTMFDKCGFTLDTYSYNNLQDYDESIFFDVIEFNEDVTFDVSFELKNPKFPLHLFKYKDSFPTSWFYVNFQDELEQAIEETIEKKQQLELENQIKNKQHKELCNDLAEAKKQILEIVPKELLKYISFVSIENLKKNVTSQATKKYQETLVDKVKKLETKGILVSDNYKNYKADGGELEFAQWLKELELSLLD